MWVANSATVGVPCPSGSPKPTGQGSVTFIASNGVPRPKPFTGGGLTIPWGIAVDGNDKRLGRQLRGQARVGTLRDQTRELPAGQLHRPAGITTQRLRLQRPDPQHQRADRPSGNVWITNNWKTHPLPRQNPGGYQMVVYIGAEGPLRTPLIGPPRPLNP